MNDPKTVLEPLAGYLIDMVAKLRNRPFVPHSLTKLHNLKIGRDLSGASTVIEVGSYKGVTTRRLARIFDRVISIEIDQELHEEAKRRCAGCRNIELILGDGSTILPHIVPRMGRSLVFLDGHFSGGVTAQGDEPEPVLKELSSFTPYLDKIGGLVIDDFRLFGVEAGWPSKYEVMKRLEEIFVSSDWKIVVQFDQFLVYPKHP